MGPNFAPMGGYPEPDSGQGDVVHLPGLPHSAPQPSIYCAQDLGSEYQLETLLFIYNRYTECLAQLDKAAELLRRSPSSNPMTVDADLSDAKSSLLLAGFRLGTVLQHIKWCDPLASTQCSIEEIEAAIKKHFNSIAKLIPDPADSQLSTSPEEACKKILAEGNEISKTATTLAPLRKKVSDAIQAKELELNPPKSA